MGNTANKKVAWKSQKELYMQETEKTELVNIFLKDGGLDFGCAPVLFLLTSPGKHASAGKACAFPDR